MRRQRALWGLIAVSIAATLGTMTAGGFRLHHAVVLERQSLRTQTLAEAALELHAAPGGSRAALAAAFANVATHDHGEGLRLYPSYLVFRSAPSSGLLLTTFQSRITAESERLAASTRVANPAARAALIAACSFAVLSVLLLILQFELERRAGRLDRDNVARAAELVRLRDEFVAVVSHELRTPLTSIIGYLELLVDDGELTPEQQAHIAIVQRSTNRLVSLVGDLLVVAEAERGPLTLDLTDVDLAELAEDAVESARPTAQTKTISLELRRDADSVVRGDRMRLAQMLDNLVSNAIKFTPDGGAVTVATSRVNGDAVVEVRDTGSGIARADREHVFEPFFRARGTTSRAVPGTGLGLAIAKAIADAHGGRIELAGDDGAGAVFRVHLPVSGV